MTRGVLGKTIRESKERAFGGERHDSSFPIGTGRSCGFGGSASSTAPHRPWNSFLPINPATIPATMLTGLNSNYLVLIAVATHKASRLITKDRVTSAVRAPFTEFESKGGPAEVEERARGRELRRAVGELLICPFCLSMWLGAGFAAGLGGSSETR